jgi:hypothetical protein
VQTVPHLERLARLLHNRVVRRVRHSHPLADAMLLVGDLLDGHVHLHPVAVWDAAGTVVAGAAGTDSADALRPAGSKIAEATTATAHTADTAWRLLVRDLRPEFALLARVAPVALFEPYVLDLRQIDLPPETGSTD